MQGLAEIRRANAARPTFQKRHYKVIAAAIADECFAWLDAPVKRIASTDTFVGYAPRLEDAILPQVEDFRKAYEEIVKF